MCSYCGLHIKSWLLYMFLWRYVFGEIRRYPFLYQALLRLLPFSRCAVKGICYIFFEYNFFVKPSVCELLLWLLMSVSGWCMTMSRFFICVMPGKVLAKGVDTLYYGKNKPCRYNDYFLILIWWWLIFCYLCKTKFWKNGTKGINICFNVFGC